jgi:hypothetical protein
MSLRLSAIAGAAGLMLAASAEASTVCIKVEVPKEYGGRLSYVKKKISSWQKLSDETGRYVFVHVEAPFLSNLDNIKCKEDNTVATIQLDLESSTHPVDDPVTAWYEYSAILWSKPYSKKILGNLKRNYQLTFEWTEGFCSVSNEQLAFINAAALHVLTQKEDTADPKVIRSLVRLLAVECKVFQPMTMKHARVLRTRLKESVQR